jgi:hypothetical protein
MVFTKFSQGLAPSKGLAHTWKRLAELGPCLQEIKAVKSTIKTGLKGSYQGSAHTTPDTSHLAWKVANSIEDHGLHTICPDREESERIPLVKNLIRNGSITLQRSTLETFNKKFDAYACGSEDTETLHDELPQPDFSFEEGTNDELLD